MKLNSLLFPAPESSYDSENLYKELLYIPRRPVEKGKHKSITSVAPNPSSLFHDNQIEEEKFEQKGISSSLERDIDDASRQKSKSQAPANESCPSPSPDVPDTAPPLAKESDIKKPKGKKPKGAAYIPCLFLPYERGSCKIMLYFHGNAEDIGAAYELLDHMRQRIKVHILAVEYPGYGIYYGQPSSDKISEDAKTVFDYLVEEVGWRPKDIFIFGRSMGSGPGTELAATRNPGILLLMSAYTSIRNVAKSIAGKMLQFVIAERFRNIDLIKEVTCPTFLIHGQKDNLIPFSHSQELHAACQGPCSLILPKEMDHNEFDFFEDLSQPFYLFLLQCGISVQPTPNASHVKFEEKLFQRPEDFPEGKNSSSWNKFIRKFF